MAEPIYDDGAKLEEVSETMESETYLQEVEKTNNNSMVCLQALKPLSFSE